MGVYIKGMEMPKSCSDCSFSEVYDHGDGDEFTCEITWAFTFDYADYKGKRLPSCPLIESQCSNCDKLIDLIKQASKKIDYSGLNKVCGEFIEKIAE